MANTPDLTRALPATGTLMKQPLILRSHVPCPAARILPLRDGYTLQPLRLKWQLFAFAMLEHEHGTSAGTSAGIQVNFETKAVPGGQPTGKVQLDVK